MPKDDIIMLAKAKLLQDVSKLFEEREMADVKLKVEDKIFSAHKCILVQRLEYFKIILTGNFTETLQDVVELKDVNADGFEVLLAFIYGIFPDFDNMELERILNVLQVSKYFVVESLVELASETLLETINSENFLLIFDIAYGCSIEILLNRCMEEIFRAPLEALKHEYFSQLSNLTLKKILSFDFLYAPEIRIFQAVQEWFEVNPDVDSKQEILNEVRLWRMTKKDLKIVRSSKLYDLNKIDEDLARYKLHSDLPMRGLFIKCRNLCENSEIITLKRFKTFPKAFKKFENEFMKMKYVEVNLSENYVVNSILLKTRINLPEDSVSIKWCCSNENIRLGEMEDVELKDVECVSPNYYLEFFPAKIMKHIRIVGLQRTSDKYFTFDEIRCFNLNDKEELNRLLKILSI